jgi:hypothetical protein
MAPATRSPCGSLTASCTSPRGSNVVLRWEYRPGSTFYIVWQQNRSLSEVEANRISLVDPFRSLAAPGANYFIIKTSYWLPFR